MNISPISFGRTIKVNASYQAASHAAELINNIPPRKGELKVQQQLKNIFYDTDKGRARVVTPNGKKGDIYIVSGESSEDVKLLLKDKQEQLNSAKDNYGKDSYTYRSINEAEQDRYLDLLKLVILETKEPIEIDIDYSKDKHRIRAIDIRI